MNLVFVSDDASEARRLKNILSTYTQAPKDEVSRSIKDIPVDLRHVTLQQIGITQDGRLQLPDNGLIPGDVIVLDSAITGDRTIHTIKDAAHRVPGVPILLLADPENESLAIDAINAGASDSIPRTDQYLVRLLSAIKREVRYQALYRQNTEIMSRENRLRLMVEGLPVGVAVIAPDGTFLAINRAGLELLGLTDLKQVVGRHITSFISEKDTYRTKAFLNIVGGHSNDAIQVEWKRLDGSIRSIHISATPMGKQGIQGSAILAAIHAVPGSAGGQDRGKEPVEREEMEKALQEYEEKFRELQQKFSSQKSGWETAIKHEESLRREAEEKWETEKSRWNQERRQLEEKIRRLEQKQAEVQTILQEADRQLSMIETSFKKSEENRGQLVEKYEEDRSEWERARREIEQMKSDAERLQSELTKEKSRYERLSRVSSFGFMVTTMEGRVLECNDTAAGMFGYAGVREAMSQTGEKDVLYACPFQDTLGKRLQREGILENVEWSLLNRDGRLVRIRESVILIDVPREDSPRVERVITDISEAYRLGDEIKRIRRIESAGDAMVSGVKNLENMCESLIHLGNHLIQSAGDGNTVRQVAETLLKDAARHSKHAQRLLSLSTKIDRIPSVVNLNEIMAENEAIWRSLVGQDIEFKMEYASGASLIVADQREIVQLISNGIVSSLKTLPYGGAVSIGTENVEIDASSPDSPPDFPSGMYVLMTISEDGYDVQPDEQTMYNRMIVERIGGWIVSANDPHGRGNVHRLYFPRVIAVAGQKTLPPKMF